MEDNKVTIRNYFIFSIFLLFTIFGCSPQGGGDSSLESGASAITAATGGLAIQSMSLSDTSQRTTAAPFMITRVGIGMTINVLGQTPLSLECQVVKGGQVLETKQFQLSSAGGQAILFLDTISPAETIPIGQIYIFSVDCLLRDPLGSQVGKTEYIQLSN